MKRVLNNPRIRWYILLIGFIIVFVSFYPINKMVGNLRKEEQKKIELWAKAISRKAELVKRTKIFYDRLTESEASKLQQYIQAYQLIMNQSLEADLSSQDLSFYTQIVLDNKTIPVIITDKDNNIQFSQNVDLQNTQKVLSGHLYKLFTKNQPLVYYVDGMQFKLYYSESEVYLRLKRLIDELNNSFLDEVSNNTVFVPVIITDQSKKNIIASSNIPSERLTDKQKSLTISQMEKQNPPIKISLPDNVVGYIFYQKSFSLTILRYFPILYVFVVVLFSFLFFMFFKTMKSSQQNSVWVGMSKETAHQLGTPISSLVGWLELLKIQDVDPNICLEINKDIERLKVIAQRFSFIGSNPTLQNKDLIEIISNAIDYMRVRSPKKIVFNINIPTHIKIIMPVNQTLLEWTFENLTKNAIDAMEGSGKITIDLVESPNKVIINFSDTGKGIQKAQFKQIFLPGYTTKKRGWGLGLSLVKRIIEQYHKGKIYVKSSVVGQGTTFTIELMKDKNNG